MTTKKKTKKATSKKSGHKIKTTNFSFNVKICTSKRLDDLLKELHSYDRSYYYHPIKALGKVFDGESFEDFADFLQSEKEVFHIGGITSGGFLVAAPFEAIEKLLIQAIKEAK